MKLTADILLRLEKLKGKGYIRTTTGYESFEVSTPIVGVVVGWKTEEIPERKGLFSRRAYTNLIDIETKESDNVGTNKVSVYDADGGYFDALTRLEKWRNDFIAVSDQLKKFGYDILKINESQTAL